MESRPRRQTGSLLGLALLVSLLAPPAAALNVDFGDIAVRNLGNFGFESTSSVLSYDGAATDELYQLFGYVGNASGMTRITGSAFSVLTDIDTPAGQAAPNHYFSVLQSQAGNGLGLGTGLEIRYDWILNDDTSPLDRDNVNWSISLTNNTAAVQTLSFYTYIDLDLGGAGDFADDTAELMGGTRRSMRVGDASDPNAEVLWTSSVGLPTHHQMGPYPGLRATLDGMLVAGDLSDNPPLGTIFGDTNGNGTIEAGEGADFTAALQYDFVINPGQTVRIAQAIAEPGASLLLMGGLLGLMGFPRLVARGEPGAA
ncbi:MAG: hypothetical protein QNK05_05455 [Myxococcota bacterium]|nr:hypothetical protein [Myxococcota bacterium]